VDLRCTTFCGSQSRLLLWGWHTLWCVQPRSTASIKAKANVCSVQFSPESPNLLVFGSADFEIACYDIRKTKAALCQLAGHGRAVSYVAFCGGNRLVSASTEQHAQALGPLAGRVRGLLDTPRCPPAPPLLLPRDLLRAHQREGAPSCFLSISCQLLFLMLLLLFMSCAPSGVMCSRWSSPFASLPSAALPPAALVWKPALRIWLCNVLFLSRAELRGAVCGR